MVEAVRKAKTYVYHKKRTDMIGTKVVCLIRGIVVFSCTKL